MRVPSSVATAGVTFPPARSPSHRIAAPEWLPAIGPGDTVIHLDLHPENVMLHGNGALVIDWANARAGNWA